MRLNFTGIANGGGFAGSRVEISQARVGNQIFGTVFLHNPIEAIYHNAPVQFTGELRGDSEVAKVRELTVIGGEP